MTAQTPITIPDQPGASLRLHLLQLFLLNTDMPDQALPLAREAEAWILGPTADLPPLPLAGEGRGEGLATTIVTESEAPTFGDPTADPCWDAIIMPGDEPDPPADLPPLPLAGEATPISELPPLPQAGEGRGEGLTAAIIAESAHAQGNPPVIGHGDDPAPADPVKPVSTRWTPERDAELLRRAEAGEKRSDIAKAMGVTSTAAVYARLSALRTGKVPSAVLETATPAAAPTPAAPDAPPPMRMANGTSPIIWTSERRDRLRDLVLAGAEAVAIATELGLQDWQVEAQITRQCLTAPWREAKAAKAGIAAPAAPPPAPARPLLPEDRLRGVDQPAPPAPADMETVADYLRKCGQDVGISETGAWTLDGCVTPPKRLLAAANTYRAANDLPVFAVRGVG